MAIVFAAFANHSRYTLDDSLDRLLVREHQAVVGVLLRAHSEFAIERARFTQMRKYANMLSLIRLNIE
jgi:hypothetical protein